MLGKITDVEHDIINRVDGCNTIDEFCKLIKERFIGKTFKEKLKDFVKEVTYINPDESV